MKNKVLRVLTFLWCLPVSLVDCTRALWFFSQYLAPGLGFKNLVHYQRWEWEETKS